MWRWDVLGIKERLAGVVDEVEEKSKWEEYCFGTPLSELRNVNLYEGSVVMRCYGGVMYFTRPRFGVENGKGR